GAGGGRHAAHRPHGDPRPALEHRGLRDAAHGPRPARDPRDHARRAAPRARAGDARARAEDDPSRADDDARPGPSRRAHRGGRPEPPRGRGRALRGRGEDGDRARPRGPARREHDRGDRRRRAHARRAVSERELRALVADVRRGRLSRRGFVTLMAGLGVTAPLAAQMLAPLPARAQARPAFTPSRRGGGGQLRVLWWQAPTLLNPHFATGTKDQDASRIFYEPLAGFDPDGNVVPILAAQLPSI